MTSISVNVNLKQTWYILYTLCMIMIITNLVETSNSLTTAIRPDFAAHSSSRCLTETVMSLSANTLVFICETAESNISLKQSVNTAINKNVEKLYHVKKGSLRTDNKIKRDYNIIDSSGSLSKNCLHLR